MAPFGDYKCMDSFYISAPTCPKNWSRRYDTIRYHTLW